MTDALSDRQLPFETVFVDDINGTTNYNAEVEAEHGLSGMASIAALIERELS